MNSFTKTAAEWELVEWKRLGQFPCGNGQAKPNDVRNWKWGMSSGSKNPGDQEILVDSMGERPDPNVWIFSRKPVVQPVLYGSSADPGGLFRGSINLSVHGLV